MTDMRATERLLEVIAELASDAEFRMGREHRSVDTDQDYGTNLESMQKLREISYELRRRGDTLVRAEDLRVLMEAAEVDLYVRASASPSEKAAIARLENALGGRMR